jgi:hypothetical protein
MAHRSDISEAPERCVENRSAVLAWTAGTLNGCHQVGIRNHVGHPSPDLPRPRFPRGLPLFLAVPPRFAVFLALPFLPVVLALPFLAAPFLALLFFRAAI